MPTIPSERSRSQGSAASRASRARQTRSATRELRSPRLPTSQLGPSSGSINASRGAIKRIVRIHRPKTQPVPSPPAAVEYHYWPTVRQHISRGHEETNDVRIKVVCPICSDELPVRGLNPSNELLQHEGGVLIACGHIFCRSCLEQTFRAQGEEMVKQSCPICRTEMECRRCGDPSRVVDIPKAHDNVHDFEELPMTIPEGGNRPANCVRCCAREWWWIKQIDIKRQGLEAQNDPVQERFRQLMYEMMDQMEDSRMPTGLVEVEQQLLGLFQRRFMQLRRERERHIQRYVTNQLMGDRRDSWQ